MGEKLAGIGAITTKKREKYQGARETRASRASQKANRGKKVPVLAWLIPAVLLAVLLVAGFVMKAGNTIYPNVTVCGVQVGGMDKKEATHAVQQAVDASYGSRNLQMDLRGQVLTLRPQDTKISVDVPSAVDLAISYGRNGGPISAVFNWFACKSKEHDVDLRNVLTYDEAYLQNLCQTTCQKVNSQLKQSEIAYDADQKIITVRMGTHEKSAVPQDMLAAILDAYSRGDFVGGVYEYEIKYCDPVDLSGYYKDLCVPAVNAEYDEKKHVLTKEVPGFGFDLEAEKQRIQQAAEGEVLTIQLGEMMPEITAESLKSELFPDVLATYSSPHTNIPARTNNLILACKAIDGTVLNPGDVFSFNKIVGERTAAKGYKAATVYNGAGESVGELGGGVCQVASTIYMCTLLADLEVVERTEHMYAVTYVPMGMDATIYWGSLDYKFKNDTQHPIFIEASVSDGKNHITLLGTKESEETIKMTYSVLATIPWEEVEEVDETKEPDYREEEVTPYTGYKVQTYKHRYDKDGNLISTEKEAYSNYRKRDKVIVVGPKEEEVTPEVPVVPVPDVPVTPAPEVPQEPAPEVPASPAPEVPQEPTPEVPVTPEPEVPAGPDTPVSAPETAE